MSLMGFFLKVDKEMNIIDVAAYNNRVAFKIFANSSRIFIKFLVNWRDDKRLPILCGKDNV